MKTNSDPTKANVKRGFTKMLAGALAALAFAVPLAQNTTAAAAPAADTASACFSHGGEIPCIRTSTGGG